MFESEAGVGTRKVEIPHTVGRSRNFDHETPLVLEDTQTERIEGFLRPRGGVEGEGPFEFVFEAQNDAYLMLSNLNLYMRAKITRENGTAITAADQVAPLNGVGVTMWEHTEVSLNDFVLSGSASANTHYKSYMETILSYDRGARDTHLKTTMWEMDTAHKYEDNTIGGENVGWKNRQLRTKNSNIFDTSSPITADFLRANNHMAPGNKLSIKMYKARDGFILNTADARRYKFEILDLKLFYACVRLKESIPPPKIERYLCPRTEVRRFPVPQGSQTFNCTFHHGGKLPKQVVIAQVETAAVEGDYKKNPLNFQHFGLNRLNLRINGRQVPSEPLKPDFAAATPLVAREYNHIFMNTGKYRVNRSNVVTEDQFCGGATVFPFDLNPDLCNGYHLHPSKPGVGEIEVAWEEALAEPITILVHTTYDEVYLHKKHENDFQIHVI